MTIISKLLPNTPKKRPSSSPPPILSPAPRSPSPIPVKAGPPSPTQVNAELPASPASPASEDPCPTMPPMSLEEVLFSGLVSRVHAENRALKAENEALMEMTRAAKHEKEDAVANLEHTKKSLESKIVALEDKNAKLKMRLKNADALLSKTELWFEAYVKLSKQATVSHGIPSPGSSEAAPSLPSSKSGRSSSNGHGSDAGHHYPHAAHAVASPPPSIAANGYPGILDKSKTRRVTSEPLPASTATASAPRVHYSPYSPHPTAPTPQTSPPSASVSRQNSQQQLSRRNSAQQLPAQQQQQQQQLGHRTSQQQLSHRISQHELVQRASQHQLVQRTTSILQRRPTDASDKRNSAEQLMGEYWSSAFDVRLQNTGGRESQERSERTERRAPPPPSTYYPPNQMRPRLPATGSINEHRRLMNHAPRPIRQAAK